MDYTPPELAKMIGKVPQYVRTYIKRGQLIPNDSGRYDIDHPVNKAWYEPRRKEFMALIATPGYVAPVKRGRGRQPGERFKKPKPKQEVLPPTPATFEVCSEEESTDQATPVPQSTPQRNTQQPKAEASEYTDWHTRKIQAEVKLKEMNLEKTRIEIEQKQGKLLNIDVAKGIVAAYMNSYSNGLFRDLETFVHRIMDVYKIPLTEKAAYSTQLEKLMNNATSRTMAELEQKLAKDNVQL